MFPFRTAGRPWVLQRVRLAKRLYPDTEALSEMLEALHDVPGARGNHRGVSPPRVNRSSTRRTSTMGFSGTRGSSVNSMVTSAAQQLAGRLRAISRVHEPQSPPQSQNRGSSEISAAVGSKEDLLKEDFESRRVSAEVDLYDVFQQENEVVRSSDI